MFKGPGKQPERGGDRMKNLKKHVDDNYLAFITIATASVMLIAAAIWLATVLVKKYNR